MEAKLDARPLSECEEEVEGGGEVPWVKRL